MTMEEFFGKVENKSNKRFQFDGSAHKNPDEITIITGNVRRFKDGFVMPVGNNKLVYLKDWQVLPVYNHEEIGNAEAVKLNRKYFKTYTWKSEFEDFYFENEDTFDSLAELAKEQANQLTWRMGHFGDTYWQHDIDWLRW
ncbi:hypothetical protein [Faecalibaculum rodentium]|uniref:hypothetical protein n=1 Tax=Faecalibaculum rodentium TaxID=1702221 RepID=UPI002594017A|nr:hypothetical protein [Faecalibaculum rodentium]